MIMTITTSVTMTTLVTMATSVTVICQKLIAMIAINNAIQKN